MYAVCVIHFTCLIFSERFGAANVCLWLALFFFLVNCLALQMILRVHIRVSWVPLNRDDVLKRGQSVSGA